MLSIHTLVVLSLVNFIYACTPFSTSFSPGSITSGKTSSAPTPPFIAITPSDSFTTTKDGLSMFLRKPPGDITRTDGVNSQLGEGTTINSTFTLLYGKVTFEVSFPTLVPGVVVAVILIADEHDEIDIEMIGGDADHWQSNVYAPSPSDTQPLWGVFGKIQDLPRSPSTIASVHAYTIDWNADRIIWSVDGIVVRTLEPHQTRKNGRLHYPSHAMRLQLGIWDASSPLGTAQWAKGPIDWTKAPAEIHALVRGVKVECSTP
ncbi:glycoside hydrolase family 16 protein [Gautieria morchelliformis]|nr:glycoside hydrolase family 16 protein [Gautieria morchelliformis]